MGTISERLKPVKRMLEDLETAESLVEQTKQEAEYRQSVLKSVREELEELQAKRQSLIETVAAYDKKYTERVAEAEKDFAGLKAGHEAVLSALQETVTQETELWAAREAELKAKHDKTAAERQALVADLTEQIGKLTGALEAYKRDVTPVLSRV